MTEEEKIKFVIDVFEYELPFYMNSAKQYDRQDKLWLDKYLTKANFDGILKANLESVYQTALNIVKNR